MAAIPQSLPAANDPADQDPVETREWLDALETVIQREGPERAHFLLEQMLDLSRRSGANIPFSNTTGYVNTIPTQL
jgi:pyruvate dehydrogenase E1 component